MQVDAPLGGHIVISNEIEQEIEILKAKLQSFRVVVFYEESFKIEHAKAVMAEAYVSETSVKYIIIAAIDLTDVAQNSLLKLLEEPPKNIEFIIISPTKSNLLPTVRSRLPMLKSNHSKHPAQIEIDFAKISYEQIFEFLKTNGRVSKNEAKELVEAIYHKATVIDKLILSKRQLDNFDMAYRLIDLNARAQSVFAMLLMGFTRQN